MWPCGLLRGRVEIITVSFDQVRRTGKHKRIAQGRLAALRDFNSAHDRLRSMAASTSESSSFPLAGWARSRRTRRALFKSYTTGLVFLVKVLRVHVPVNIGHILHRGVLFGSPFKTFPTH
jgi:hypothetical protein